ncbi:MAG: hypothetical protein PWR13_415 [Archaeoglobi archaeon]|nr:hypothetical protein [Archaeoglobi archaeon]
MPEVRCKKCGSRNVEEKREIELKMCCKTVSIGGRFLLCGDCGYWWEDDSS